MWRLERVAHRGLISLVSHVRGSEAVSCELAKDDGARVGPTLHCMVCAQGLRANMKSGKCSNAITVLSNANMGVYVEQPGISLQRCPNMEIRIDTPKG
jgi:hypothetical protein